MSFFGHFYSTCGFYSFLLSDLGYQKPSSFVDNPQCSGKDVLANLLTDDMKNQKKESMRAGDHRSK